MTGELRACVIGAGQMGRHHIRALTELEDVELVGIADTDPGSLRAAIRGRSARGYDDVASMLEAERPDLAVVAVPTLAHEEVALAALDAGAHLLIEKPVTSDRAAAERVRELADRRGLLVTVGHIERFNPAIVELRRRLADGTIGPAFQVVVRRTGPFPERVRDLGVVKDLATHDLDVIRFALGSPFEWVFAQVARHLHPEHEDLLMALGRLANGTIAALEVNWLTPTKVRELRVVGEGGMYVADYLRQDLTLYRNGEGKPEFGAIETFTGVSEGEVIVHAIQRKEPLRAELEAFVAAVRSGSAPPVPVFEALESLALATAVLESARLDQPVAPSAEG